MKKQKSLYNAIIDILERELTRTQTDGHYKGGRNQAYYAISNSIGHIKAEKEGRDLKKKR